MDELARKATRQSDELELMAGRRRSACVSQQPADVGEGVVNW